MDSKIKKRMLQSEQIQEYKSLKFKRDNFKNLYKSEKHIFKKYLKNCKTVMDIGCLYGSFRNALKKFNIDYYGIDSDPYAIKYGKKINKNIKLFNDDFIKPKKKYGKYDFVFSLNVFEHYTNWKKIIKSYKKFSKKYFCFTSNLKLEGNASLDFETSCFYYNGEKKPMLWSLHNMFELISYLSSMEMNAKKIYVYAYNKYNKKNFYTAAFSAMPIDPRKLLIGIFVVELNNKKKTGTSMSYKRPNIEIIINDKNYLKTNW